MGSPEPFPTRSCYRVHTTTSIRAVGNGSGELFFPAQNLAHTLLAAHRHAYGRCGMAVPVTARLCGSTVRVLTECKPTQSASLCANSMRIVVVRHSGSRQCQKVHLPRVSRLAAVSPSSERVSRAAAPLPLPRSHRFRAARQVASRHLPAPNTGEVSARTQLAQARNSSACSRLLSETCRCINLTGPSSWRRSRAAGPTSHRASRL